RRLLDDLLHDSSVTIVREAITTAGVVGYTESVPLLIEKLADKSLRRDSRQAILAFGDLVIPELVQHLSDSNESLRIRMRVPKTVALSGNQTAADTLIRNLHCYGYRLDYAILKALNRLRVNVPQIVFDADAVRSAINREREEYEKLRMVQAGFQANPIDPALFTVLFRALNERLEEKRERIFRLLGVIYTPQENYSLYYNYRVKPESAPPAI